MALVLVIEDGTAKADANSYASVANADAYHEAHLYATAWTGASTPNKEKALAMATRLIDGEFAFNGTRRTTTQALQGPREGCPDMDGGDVHASNTVPKGVVVATCELARELLVLDRTSAPPGEGISVQTNADQSQIVYSKKDRRQILTAVVMSLLCRYGVLLKKAAMVRLERA